MRCGIYAAATAIITPYPIVTASHHTIRARAALLERATHTGRPAVSWSVAVQASFVGAMAIADLVKSTLGPKGMDKILQVG